MAARLRRRAPNRPSAKESASISARSHRRMTRRTSIRAQTVLRNAGDVEDDDLVTKNTSDEGADDDEAETEDDEEVDEDADFSPPRRAPKRKRSHSKQHFFESPPKRRRQPRRGTTESSDGSDNEDDTYLSPPSERTTPRRGKVATFPDRMEWKRKNKTEKANPTSSKKAVVITIDDEARFSAPTPDAVVQTPPWDTLPYLILARIFMFASAPLDNVGSLRWLLGVSRTCRAFAEPAMKTLYECPPMLTMNMALMLADFLEKPASTTLFDCQQKIKALHIDVGSLASHSYKGRHLDISSMVAHCPRLADLDLYHYKDMPPYRQLTENLRWSYPESLFKALGASAEEQRDVAVRPATKLKSWRWNQRLMCRNFSFDDMQAVHMSPAFQGLRKIVFTNYQRPSLLAKNADDLQVIAEDKQQAEAFARLLEVLPSLTHLVIESSTVVNELLLPLLPKTLQHLELINCWDVTAAHFSQYLVTHGQHLRHLSLHHNQSLSLAFLPVLGKSCPQLLSLQMNLTYFSHHAFYNDSNPLYDSLLLDSQVPSWPPSIQTIELEHLRKWEPSAAAMFLQSLVDSAPHMPMLRKLAIKVTVDIPWRHRCQMRDQWEAELNRVFKRRVSMPEPAATLQYYQNKEAFTPSPQSKLKTRRREENQTPQRRSHRIAVHASNSSSRTSSATRGLRHSQRGRISYREPDSDEEEEEEVTEDEDAEEGPHEHRRFQDEHTSPNDPDAHIHGMCDVVDIRIDNQKPVEIQYRMADFIDSDNNNSDEEWTGDGVEVSEYAW